MQLPWPSFWWHSICSFVYTGINPSVCVPTHSFVCTGACVDVWMCEVYWHDSTCACGWQLGRERAHIQKIKKMQWIFLWTGVPETFKAVNRFPFLHPFYFWNINTSLFAHMDILKWVHFESKQEKTGGEEQSKHTWLLLTQRWSS